MMRLLILALAVPAFAQPALAREHSRHHARLSAHSHHANFLHGARHHARAWGHVRRYREPGFAFAGERYGAFADRRLEYRPSFDNSGFADRPFARDFDRPIAPTFTRRSERRVFSVAQETRHGALDAMIARHAQANGLPESLVHRVVIRESRYNPRAVGRGGAMGLMQIKYSTARAMGYTGSPSGLLDPDTNLTYAVRYLAGAYRAAHGSSGGAVSNYARGYYGAAKRARFSPYQGPGSFGVYASAQPEKRLAWIGYRRHASRWR